MLPLGREGPKDFTMTSLREANAKFTIDFFHQLRKGHPCGNILFSPANLSAALHLLLYGSQCDTKAELEKVLHHLKKAEEHASSGTRSSSLVTPGEDETQAEGNLGRLDGEEVSASYFIPWRKHLLGMEDVENLVQEPSSPEGKVSQNPSTSHENQEEQSVNKIMAVAAEASLPPSSSSAHVASDNISALLSEFRHTVKHADYNVQAFKETFGIFKECCDKVCTSMSNLQVVLEALVTILRE